MSLNATHFTASDGRQIRLSPGWLEQLDGWPMGVKNFQDWVEMVVNEEGTYPSGFSFFLNKLWTAQSMIELLRQHAISLPINGPILDLCTGPAILPRVFKALGVCTQAYGIDLYSRLKDYPDQVMVDYWKAVATIIQRSTGSKDDPRFATADPENLTIADPENLTINIFDKCFLENNKHQTGLNNAGGIIFEKFDASRVGMDEYIEGDVYKDCPDIKFPLITLAAGLEYFAVSEFFSIVSNFLSPGGLFLTFNYYFYQVFAGMFIPLDAPWLHARLTHKDLMRYYETVRPEFYKPAKALFKKVQTPYLFAIHDYKELAEKFGLELVGYRRVIRKETLSILFSNEEFRNLMYSEVLPDCQSLNPNVQMDDLFTNVLAAVYRKKEN